MTGKYRDSGIALLIVGPMVPLPTYQTSRQWREITYAINRKCTARSTMRFVRGFMREGLSFGTACNLYGSKVFHVEPF